MIISQKNISVKQIDMNTDSYIINLNLENLKKGDTAIVKIVPKNLLLAPLGIREGKPIKLETKQSFGGPIVVSIEGRKVAISRHIARQIGISIGDIN